MKPQCLFKMLLLSYQVVQAQAAIALEECLTSPTKREDAPSLLVRVP